MGLDIVILFCVFYSGLVLTGMWFVVSRPREAAQARRPKLRLASGTGERFTDVPATGPEQGFLKK